MKNQPAELCAAGVGGGENPVATRGFRRIEIATALCLALINLAVFVTGVPRLRIYGHDVFVSLDGGWRVLNGQIPVVDFLGQMGPLYYLLHAVGLGLAGADARGLGYGSTIAGVLIAIWSFLLLRRRMFPALFFAACIAITVLAVAPFPLGLEHWRTAFSMKHNRYCFALMLLVLLESFLPPRADRRDGTRWAGFSTGFACAVMFFIKISYGLVGTVIAAVSVLFRARERGRVAGIAAGIALGTVPVLAWLRFDVAALIREYRLLAAVRSAGIAPARIARRLYADRFVIAPALVVAVMVAIQRKIAPRRRLELTTAAMLALGAGTLLLLTNTQYGGLPLLTGVALLMANEWTALPRDARMTPYAFIFWFALACCAIPVARDAEGVAYAGGDRFVHREPGSRLSEPHLQALEFVDCDDPDRVRCQPNDNGQLFVGFTEEALMLAKLHAKEGESIRGLGMSNPFSYAMLAPPSRGGSVNLSDTNVSESAVAPEERLIGDPDLLLVPTFPASARDILAIVLARYPDLLTSEYEFVDASPNWRLYHRTK